MDAETAGLVSSLREQLDRLTALVRTLLEMSNLQSVSRTDQIALAPLVEEILTDLTSLAQKNNISLQQDCAELGMVGSDALIYRLVFNLVENGIKYNHPGGAVRVTLRQERQNAVLRVADTGPGIPADCRESIFEPFFRVDKSRSRGDGRRGAWACPCAGDRRTARRRRDRGEQQRKRHHLCRYPAAGTALLKQAEHGNRASE